ncbi:MAG: hypothetical protein A2Y53_01545 [Chloroflexi bacterium RBG_16_47_49]|nr:MAG: hypothetical protein A2Y53_01545 [Chloroflexi bacterium RBG_16_47_49]
MTERMLDRIFNANLPAISKGEVALEAILAKYPQYAGELRPRFEAALWLQQAKQAVNPRSGYIISSRKYLEAQIESLRPIGFWQRLFRRYSPQRWVFNITAPIIVFLLLALVINSAVLTARLSIPGDPLYSTKLVIEDVQLALTFNQLDRTDLLIQRSHERALEFIELVIGGDYEYLPTAAVRMETEIIASLHSLTDMSFQNQTVEQSMTAKLRETLTNEIFMLKVLNASSPPSAYPGIELAMQIAQSGLMVLR